jgi:hypothetical protein
LPALRHSFSDALMDRESLSLLNYQTRQAFLILSHFEEIFSLSISRITFVC